METDIQEKKLEMAMKELSKSIMCGICLDDISSPLSLICSHTFCKKCLLEVRLKFFIILPNPNI